MRTISDKNATKEEKVRMSKPKTLTKWMDIWEFCMYLTLGEYQFFSIKNENIALGIIMQYINVQYIVQFKLLRGD